MTPSLARAYSWPPTEYQGDLPFPKLWCLCRETALFTDGPRRNQRP